MAMGLAIIYPEPEKGGRGIKKRVEETSTVFSAKRLQQARAVLSYSRELAVEVERERPFADLVAGSSRLSETGRKSISAQVRIKSRDRTRPGPCYTRSTTAG
jgi:hypothetical protein